MGLLGRERAGNDGASGPVKVYVSPTPPHKARFGSALLGLGGGLIAFGVVWIVGAVAAVR